jgi:TetR/AcrR family transcriptional regulator, transcriptional repressor for nem operon
MVSTVKEAEATRGLVGYGAGASGRTPLPTPPTQARGAEKRDKIYRAALSRYGAYGVNGTRVEDVIADAGVSWATFFRYFPRKEDVLIEAIARHFREGVRTAADEGLGDRRLRMRTVTGRTFAALLEPAELPRSLHSAALLEVFAYPDRFAALVDNGHPQPMVGVVAEVLTEAQRRGELRRDVEPDVAALIVVAGALFPGAQAAAAAADPGPAVETALEILWGGLAERDPPG